MATPLPEEKGRSDQWKTTSEAQTLGKREEQTTLLAAAVLSLQECGDSRRIPGVCPVGYSNKFRPQQPQQFIDSELTPSVHSGAAAGFPHDRALLESPHTSLVHRSSHTATSKVLF